MNESEYIYIYTPTLPDTFNRSCPSPNLSFFSPRNPKMYQNQVGAVANTLLLWQRGDCKTAEAKLKHENMFFFVGALSSYVIYIHGVMGPL